MKIVFFGTPHFAVISLRRILDTGRHPVAGVVTQPDRPAGRGRKPASPPIKVCAAECGLPVLQPVKLVEPGFLAELDKWGAECFVVVAYRILPEAVFSMPAHGTINLHASLLPSYRGAAPIRWALFEGKDETGLTTFLIQKKVDTGDILLTRNVTIGPEENHGELEQRLAATGAELLVETLDKWERKEVAPHRQDPTLASKAPKITAEDRHLNWTDHSQKIFNRVRGLAPDPGAVSSFRGSHVKILQCQTAAADGTPPAGATITAHPKDGILVATGDGALRLTKIQLAGKRPISGAEFVRGYRIEPGEKWS